MSVPLSVIFFPSADNNSNSLNLFMNKTDAYITMPGADEEKDVSFPSQREGGGPTINRSMVDTLNTDGQQEFRLAH